MKRLSINIKGQLILCLLLSIAIMTGCTIQAASPVVHERNEAKVNFELLKPPYPGFLDEAVNALKQKGGSKVIHKNGSTFVIIALGQRPSAGYSIGIESIQQATGKLIVHYVEKKPQGMAASVITYPVVIVKMPKSDLPLQIQAK